MPTPATQEAAENAWFEPALTRVVHLSFHVFPAGFMTHGSKSHRQHGSIGSSTTPGRVYPGLKMAGHMGAERVCVKQQQVRWAAVAGRMRACAFSGACS